MRGTKYAQTRIIFEQPKITDLQHRVSYYHDYRLHREPLT